MSDRIALPRILCKYPREDFGASSVIRVNIRGEIHWRTDRTGNSSRPACGEIAKRTPDS
jgi:hypothetical protein